MSIVKKEIGEGFIITPTKPGGATGLMRVCDPCVGHDPEHLMSNVRTGRWLAFIEIDEQSHMVESLIVKHETLAGQPVSLTTLASFRVGVDSGQAGFWNEENYDRVRENYEEICELTTNESEAGSIPDLGVVSSSGFGDGEYPLYLKIDDEGLIVAAQITFMIEDEEEEEDTEE